MEDALAVSGLPKTFDELVSGSDLPVLVDFWAAWCGPCRMVSPVIEKIASAYKGRLLTVKVNVDEKQHVAAKYSITGIPTIMLFHQGEILMRLTGALSFETIRMEIEKVLPPGSGSGSHRSEG